MKGSKGDSPGAAATAVFVPALALNFGWELLQCSLYVMPPDTGSIWWHCFRAGVGDAVLVLLIWAAGWLIFHGAFWFENSGAGGYALMVLGGLCVGGAMEWISVHLLKRWTYGPEMPVVLGLQVGLLPLLQLAVLSPLVFRLATLSARWQRAAAGGR